MGIVKYIRYFWHIIEHKWYVGLACLKKFMIWEALVHDLSKFLPSEFVASANFFYGSDEEKAKWTASFHISWLKHIHRNKHHWNYWLLVNDDSARILEMPKNCIKSMICDWTGSGKSVKGAVNVQKWFSINEKNIKLHKKTRRNVIDELYKKV